MNPFLERLQARVASAATEADLQKIAAACARAAAAALHDRGARGQSPNRRKVGKHFTIAITGDSFAYARNQDSVTAERSCTDLRVAPAPGRRPGQPGSGSSDKALAQAGRAFRAFNTDLDIRPISGTGPRTGSRARVLADAVVLHHLAHAGPARARPVHRRREAPPRPAWLQPGRPRRPLPEGTAKAAAKRTGDELPVHSFASRLTDLATICLNDHHPRRPGPARLPASHHPDRRPAPRLRPARRQPPPWHRVVSSPARTSRKPR